jgi:hypothetical protein
MPFPFRWRRLSRAQDLAIAARHHAGEEAPALALAYRVSVRTIWRAIARAGEQTVTVRAGDWQAPFALTPEGPVQVDQWRPAS